jgi:hypothetical protein
VREARRRCGEAEERITQRKEERREEAQEGDAVIGEASSRGTHAPIVECALLLLLSLALSVYETRACV